jgi:flavocytochrome c
MLEKQTRMRGIRRSRSSASVMLPFGGHSLAFVVVVTLACFSLTTTTTLTTEAASLTPTSGFLDFIPTNGPIDDAACNIEELEEANDSQLFSILHELSKTAMFRNFVVDLDHKCPLDKPEDDEDEFTCGGGGGDDKEKDNFAGLDLHDDDDDDEPLCSIDAGDPLDPFGSPFDSNALNALSQGGFQSKAQQDTFAWNQHVDVVVSNDEEPPCDEDGFLPDSFWLDICSNIQAGDGSKVVNLVLNPERNTGYNGAHIWKAIYEENCITTVDGDDSDMCLEERVLYRLLSGLHTSTTISIAMNYYPPSKRKGRVDWEANPTFFMEKFGKNPEYIRNMHFAYVVTLRALQKASPFLYNYEIRTGDIVEDETATVLLKRLLDSGILKSCSNIFSAFDESLMFKESNLDVVSLQQNFKGVFHNVSSILDCVQCQQCKLHGKMAMLGYGTALKILFMRPENLELDRNEIVALINTVAKLSESIREVRKLTDMFMDQQEKPEPKVEKAGITDSTATSSQLVFGDNEVTLQLVDMAIGLASSLGKNGWIEFEREVELVELALSRNSDLLLLVKYYSGDQSKFLQVSQSLGSLGSKQIESTEPDAIIVGSGLAGLAASLNILDRGGRVILIEKEHLLGGNSNKASSGINAYSPSEEDKGASTDTLELFFNDTYRSAGSSARLDLIETLVSRSGDAVTWLKTRAGVDLSLVAQLGGHSTKRTHRPSNGMAGAEIIYGMQKAVRAYEKTGQLEILFDTRVTRLLTDDGSVNGVEYVGVNGQGQPTKIHAPNVVLATGGFAADRSAGSFLEHYRPELLQMSTTAGDFSTGDGISLATALGASTVDMDKVQIHPTGWIDPTDPDNTSKTLAAELMRGVGGILMNDKGARFCNELGNRAYVTEQMLSHNSVFAKEGVWDANARVPTFNLILSSSAAEAGKKHVDLYSHKGLITRLEGVDELARWMGLPKATVVSTLQQYQKVAKKGVDEFGKTDFQGVPDKKLDTEIFYGGKVTPVLHYCMGGITIDKEGNVLSEEGSIIPGLHAAGEVTGGVHGVNRLGGNSLLECTVYGTIVGQKIPVKASSRPTTLPDVSDNAKERLALRTVPYSELQMHNTPDDCWVAIHGTVYDLTEFAEEHPAGPESIYELAGKDGTEAFAAVHNERMLEDFIDDQIGILERP